MGSIGTEKKDHSMSDAVNVFIGYDENEIVAYHTLAESIHARSSVPVTITPLRLSQLSDLYKREIDPLASTQFSFSRFLTPYLSKFEGWSLFMDCDMLMLADIAELFALRDDNYAIMCCQHDYVPKSDTKFLNNVQTKYEKKNWSSVMLFNNAKCQALTPDYVGSATGLQLHQFKWLEGDHLIGSIPLEWNWLVGEYDYKEEVKNVHFTEGGPYFTEFVDTDYADLWFAERDKAFSVVQRSDLPK